MPDPSQVPEPDSTPRSKRVAHGVVANWARLIVTALVGVGQAPILFANLPAVQLGVWYLLFALAGFISLSDLGLPSTFGRSAAYLSGRRNAEALPPPHSLGQLYVSALIATVLVSVAAALIALPAALLYFGKVIPAGVAPGTLLLPLLVFLAGVVLNLVAGIPLACLSGCGEVVLDSAVRTAASVTGFVLVCALLPRYHNLEALSAIYVVQGLVALLGSHLLLVRRGILGRIRGLGLDLRLVGSMYRESAAIFTSRFGSWLTVESTLLIAGYLLDARRIADFALLRQMVGIGASVTTAIPLAVAPHISAAHAAGDPGKARGLYLAAVRYALIVNVAFTVGALLWAPVLIHVLVGEGHFLGYAVLVPLVLGSLLQLHAAPHAFFVWSVGQWPFAPYVVAGGVLNAGLCALGASTSGFEGLAWATTVASAAIMDWVQVAVALRTAALAFRDYAKETLLPGAAYAFGVAIVGFAIRALFEQAASGHAAGGRIAGAAIAAAGISATALCAGVLAWILTLTPADRSYFLRLARVRR